MKLQRLRFRNIRYGLKRVNFYKFDYPSFMKKIERVEKFVNEKDKNTSLDLESKIHIINQESIYQIDKNFPLGYFLNPKEFNKKLFNSAYFVEYLVQDRKNPYYNISISYNVENKNLLYIRGECIDFESFMILEELKKSKIPFFEKVINIYQT